MVEEETQKTLKRQGLYPCESEIARRLSQSENRWRRIAPQLEREGLPKIDPLMRGRFWPAVEAFFRNRAGLSNMPEDLTRGGSPTERSIGMAREPGDAPGLEWIKRARDGARIPRWRARKSAVALGYRPSFIRLYIDPNDYVAIAERCRVEWAKMEAWLANEQSVPRFDGTIESLIDIYASDENSPYQDLKYRTQVNYDKDLRLLKKTVGERRVDKLTAMIFVTGIANGANLSHRDRHRASVAHTV